MKGNHYKMQQKCQRDEKTRVEVVRLTDNKANYDRPYFTATQFTGDGKYTMIVSDFTGTSKISNPDAPAIGKIGFGELFLLDLEKGEALQLTEGEAIKMGHGAHAVIQPDGKKAFYYSNACLKEVNLETLESKTLMDIPFSYNFHSLRFGKGNASAHGHEYIGKLLVGLSRIGIIHSCFLNAFYDKIVLIAVASGNLKLIGGILFADPVTSGTSGVYHYLCAREFNLFANL